MPSAFASAVSAGVAEVEKASSESGVEEESANTNVNVSRSGSRLRAYYELSTEEGDKWFQRKQSKVKI